VFSVVGVTRFVVSLRFRFKFASGKPGKVRFDVFHSEIKRLFSYTY
jgi:hypothetical protein